MRTYKKIAGIYSIYCTSNDKYYIGSSFNIKSRWANHRNQLHGNKHTNRHLQNAFNLYGRQSFIWNIVQIVDFTLSQDELIDLETKWVLRYKAHEREHGYNKCMPGNYALKEKHHNTTLTGGRGKPIMLINKLTGEITEYSSTAKYARDSNVNPSKIWDAMSYWVHDKGRKSYKGVIIIRKEDYIPDFDYINFKRPPKVRKARIKLPKIEAPKLPYGKQERRLAAKNKKPIILYNVSTKEELEFESIALATECLNLNRIKVAKCLRNEFGRFMHKGFFLKHK